jgi:choline dehydrogenase
MFDYIIVGAGSAGCVLANRLSQDPSTNVLLIEAGGSDRHPHVSIPAAFSKLFRSSRDWNYNTQPEPHLDHRTLFMPRGKMLGGSSSMNGMIYIRGNREDFDEWRDAFGCEGWGWDDVLPYFIKAEDNERGADEYHGSGGPLSVADLRTINPFTHRFVAAMGQIGVPRTNDFNGPRQTGAGVVQVTQKNGARHSAATAYLKPALTRPNLTVRQNTFVNKVIIEDGIAVGVEVESGSGIARIGAAREVILSGGAINSPQLLMLSGIGPKAHLAEHHIEVSVDSPNVGQNFHDHPVSGVTWSTPHKGTLAEAESPKQLFNYLRNRRGMLTSNVGEATAFVAYDGGRVPDIQFFFAPGYFQNHGLDGERHRSFSIGALLLRPESRGSISLRSSDPRVHPDIVGNVLEDERDTKTLVKGVRQLVSAAHAPAFDGARGEQMVPATPLDSQEAIESYIRASTELLYHPVGTCAMGSESDAVVSPELKVNGVKGLRVVDASVMPRVTRGNTNAPTIMIAEKAADLIQQGH